MKGVKAKLLKKLQYPLEKAIDRITFFQETLSVLPEHPEYTFTRLLKVRGNNFFLSIYEMSSEFSDLNIEIHEIQDYMYAHIFPLLKEEAEKNQLSVEFSYDSSIFPAPIIISVDKEIVGLMDVYMHQFIFYLPDDIQKERSMLQDINKDMLSLTDDLTKYEGYMKDPLEYGNSNWEKTKIIFRQKKTLKTLETKKDELMRLNLQQEQAKIAQQVKLEHLENNFKENQWKLYQFAKRFVVHYGYSVEEE